jgi:hypothetical protein
MSRITSEQRRSEGELWGRFEAQRPQIFGALLDCVARGLQQSPHVRLTSLPRMADFALWSVATEAFPPGAFMAAFDHAAAEATEAVIEADPVAIAVAAFMVGRDDWHGTAATLLGELSLRDRTEAEPSKWKTWPREASAFGKRLRMTTAVLRKIGIEVVFGKASNRAKTRTVTLSKILHRADRSDRSDRSDGSDTSPTNHARSEGAPVYGTTTREAAHTVRAVRAVRSVHTRQEPPAAETAQ